MQQMARSYSDETRAAVMAALLEGQSVRDVARKYDLPRGTVGHWASELHRDGRPVVSDSKKQEIGELLLDYLRANLATLKAQAELFAQADWLKKQEASQAAVLHGVMTDKAIRLIEVFARHNDAAPDSPPTD